MVCRQTVKCKLIAGAKIIVCLVFRMKPLEKYCDEPVIQNSVLRHFIHISQAPLLHPIWFIII